MGSSFISTGSGWPSHSSSWSFSCHSEIMSQKDGASRESSHMRCDLHDSLVWLFVSSTQGSPIMLRSSALHHTTLCPSQSQRATKKTAAGYEFIRPPYSQIIKGNGNGNDNHHGLDCTGSWQRCLRISVVVSSQPWYREARVLWRVSLRTPHHHLFDGDYS